MLKEGIFFKDLNMTLKWILHLGISLSTLIITTTGNSTPRAENVHWMSLDFKTVLIWSTTSSEHTYTVRYSEKDKDFQETPDCIQLSEPECDLTHNLQPFDRSYIADIQTESETLDYQYTGDDQPHTLSPLFNPYRESNISAVTFTVENIDETRVLVKITDPVTSIHVQGKQLTIRDILKKDLKYKISYYKSGSTGKKDVISDSIEAEVSNLDPGQSYCFVVVAYIPSRPKATQQGALSKQLCIQRSTDILQELGPEAWILIVLTVAIIIIIAAIILYCKCCRHRNRNLHMTQSSPI